MQELLKLVITNKTQMSMLTLYDKLQTQQHALESLGLTQNKFPYMLLSLVESALIELINVNQI